MLNDRIMIKLTIVSRKYSYVLDSSIKTVCQNRNTGQLRFDILALMDMMYGSYNKNLLIDRC